jgi:hypothetical protein
MQNAIEAAMQAELLSVEHRQLVADFEAAEPLAAQAEADYRRSKARFQLRYRHTHKTSEKTALLHAEADDEISGLHSNMLVSQAQIWAMKEKLEWYKQEMRRLNSLSVDQRAERQLDTRYQPS